MNTRFGFRISNANMSNSLTVRSTTCSRTCTSLCSRHTYNSPSRSSVNDWLLLLPRRFEGKHGTWISSYSRTNSVSPFFLSALRTAKVSHQSVCRIQIYPEQLISHDTTSVSLHLLANDFVISSCRQQVNEEVHQHKC